MQAHYRNGWSLSFIIFRLFFVSFFPKIPSFSLFFINFLNLEKMHDKVETLMRSQGLGERADSLRESLGEHAEHLKERAESLRESLGEQAGNLKDSLEGQAELLRERAEGLRESLRDGMEGAVNASVGSVRTIFGVSTAMGFLLSLLLCSILAILLALSIQYLYHLWTCQKRGSRRFRHGKVPLAKMDWKKDVVYLYQFPRSKFVPNISPHCLKLETFLRHYKIQYEVVETMTLRSVEGKLPFIELNGEHHHDSELIIGHLIKHFDIDTGHGLNEQQQGMVRVVSRMIEHATHYPLLYFKMGQNITKFYETTLEGHAPKLLKWLSPLFVYPQVWDKLNLEGTGLHTDQEVASILRADLQALEAILGEHEWLVGNQPTLADFTFFGHIASAFNLPFDLPLHNMLFDEFPRLRALHARMAFRYFPEASFRQIGVKSNVKNDGPKPVSAGVAQQLQHMEKIAE